MENEQGSFDKYNALKQIINSLANEMSDYIGRVESAFNFAEGHTGDAWDGLFIMGLTLANLELIPTTLMITPEPYWATAPMCKGKDKLWDESWIVQRDIYTKKVDQICNTLQTISLKES